MKLSVTINGFTITSLLNLNDDLQKIQVYIYSQTVPSKVAEFIAQLTTVFTLNGIIYDTTELKNSEVILTFKKACDFSVLIDIFNKLEKAAF